MITREDIVKVGAFNKPHGIKGEISFTFIGNGFSEAENLFFICELDGIFVPFRVENIRLTSKNAALVKLNTINSGDDARLFTNKDVYIGRNAARGKDTARHVSTTTWDYFRGFLLIDETHGEIGVIADVDDSTANILFIIETENGELFIPAAEEMITLVDDDGKKIHVLLPEGILNLNESPQRNHSD